MTRTTKILLTTGGLALCGALAHAAGHRVGTPHGAPIDWLARKLALSPDQTAKVREIEDKKVRDTIAIHRRAEYAEYELGQMVLADAPDRAAVMAKIDEIARLRGEAKKIQIGARLSQRELLTPEQQEQMRDRVIAHRSRRRGRSEPATRPGGHGMHDDGQRPGGDDAPPTSADDAPRPGN
jgi:Spy/CpxP family protein refolding chaperone